jgi:hypothetical protein
MSISILICKCLKLAEKYYFKTGTYGNNFIS